jgi:hypothetical protein
VQQVGPKDLGSQIFSFLALKAEAVGEVQILRIQRQGRMMDGIFLIAEIVLVIHKKSKKIKISKQKFLIFLDTHTSLILAICGK